MSCFLCACVVGCACCSVGGRSVLPTANQLAQASKIKEVQTERKALKEIVLTIVLG